MSLLKNVSRVNKGRKEVQDLLEFVIFIVIPFAQLNVLVLEFFHSVSVNIEKDSCDSSSLVKHISVISLSSGILNLLNNLLEWVNFSDGVSEESCHEVSK